MGFTTWLIIIYLILIVCVIIAFIRRKKVLGIVLISFMALGIILLVYLWFTSSM